MNAEDCLAEASPAVKRLAAECVRAMAPLIEHRNSVDVCEAVACAASLIAFSCAHVGHEASAIETMALSIHRIARTRPAGEANVPQVLQ